MNDLRDISEWATDTCDEVDATGNTFYNKNFEFGHVWLCYGGILNLSADAFDNAEKGKLKSVFKGWKIKFV